MMNKMALDGIDRKGVRLLEFMKLMVFIGFVAITISARGIKAGLAIGIFCFPLWLLLESVNSKSSKTNYWVSKERKKHRSQLPLERDIKHIKKAMKNQDVNKAIIEGRLKEQIYKTLKNEYDLSDDQIETLKNNPEGLKEIDIEDDLLTFLKTAKDLDDLTSEKKRRDVYSRSDELHNSSSYDEVEFKKKIETVLEKLLEIHNLE